MIELIINAAHEVDDAMAAAIEQAGPDTVLYGRGAILDSLGLVALITAIEADLALRTGQDILLVSEDAMSRSRSPFRTVGSLCEYIEELGGNHDPTA